MTQNIASWLRVKRGGGVSQSLTQQKVRRRSSRSHSRGQRAEVIVEFEWRALLLPQRNAIGQSLKRHRQDSALWLAEGRQHVENYLITLSINTKQCFLYKDWIKEVHVAAVTALWTVDYSSEALNFGRRHLDFLEPEVNIFGREGGAASSVSQWGLSTSSSVVWSRLRKLSQVSPQQSTRICFSLPRRPVNRDW